MITVSEARKIAQQFFGDGYTLKKEVYENDVFYLFDFEEDFDEPSTAVYKETGEPVVYTPELWRIGGKRRLVTE